ncbi:H-X9-DG-CTERM domain-containing protein [Pseudoalteromonas sp.]
MSPQHQGGAMVVLGDGAKHHSLRVTL